MTRTDAVEPDPSVLRDWLAGLVSSIHGGARTIEGIDRKRSEYASSYDAYVIEVRLSGDETLKVFMKDFGFSRRPKTDPGQRRDRELRVYRDLLSTASLGTPRYYGSIWDEERGRHWLFLEFVQGTEVRYCGVEYWIAAAGWIGSLQGHFARTHALLDSCDFLQRHDAAFFWSTAERALETVAQTAPSVYRRLEAVADRYQSAVSVMASQPLTLVHGAYRPQNILVRGDPGAASVCPTDWERAALGATLYDFAVFTDGFEPPVLDKMWEAYRNSARAYGVTVPARKDVQHIADRFRIHRVMNWLSQSAERGYPQEDVVGLVDLGERLVKSIL